MLPHATRADRCDWEFMVCQKALSSLIRLSSNKVWSESVIQLIQWKSPGRNIHLHRKIGKRQGGGIFVSSRSTKSIQRMCLWMFETTNHISSLIGDNPHFVGWISWITAKSPFVSWQNSGVASTPTSCRFCFPAKDCCGIIREENFKHRRATQNPSILGTTWHNDTDKARDRDLPKSPLRIKRGNCFDALSIEVFFGKVIYKWWISS